MLDHNNVGAQKPLILDCDFETDARDTGVVLKWNFNNYPIYQWIRSSHPMPLQKFKPHLDITYKASQDPKQMYRAISIVNPTWNMTGTYSCSLQSFTSAETQSAQLIVIGKCCRSCWWTRFTTTDCLSLQSRRRTLIWTWRAARRTRTSSSTAVWQASTRSPG